MVSLLFKLYFYDILFHFSRKVLLRILELRSLIPLEVHMMALTATSTATVALQERRLSVF